MRRFVAALFVVLLVAGGVGYFVLQSRHGHEMAAVRATAEERIEAEHRQGATVARELAEDLAGSLAVTLADDVARQDTAALEGEVAAVVRGHRVAGLIVLDPDGYVLATSDLRYRGRRLDDPASRAALAATSVSTAGEPPSPGQTEVDAPVMAAGRKVGVLRVFVELTP